MPSSVHCDHLIQAKSGATVDLKSANSTSAEVFDFLSIHNEKLDEPNECGDTSKYVTLNVDFDPSALAND